MRPQRPPGRKANAPGSANRRMHCRRTPGRPQGGWSRTLMSPRRPGAADSARKRLDQTLRFLLLRSRAFLQHFLEDAACALRIAHVHVCPCQIELGTDLAHRHWLQLWQSHLGGGNSGRAGWLAIAVTLDLTHVQIEVSGRQVLRTEDV